MTDITINSMYEGLNAFKAYVQANFPFKLTTFNGTADPRVGLGVAGSVPAIYVQVATPGADQTFTNLFIKTGPLATEWLPLVSSTLYSPIPIAVTTIASAAWLNLPVQVTAAAQVILPTTLTYDAPEGFTFRVYKDTADLMSIAREDETNINTPLGSLPVVYIQQWGWATVTFIGGTWSVTGDISATP